MNTYRNHLQENSENLLKAFLAEQNVEDISCISSETLISELCLLEEELRMQEIQHVGYVSAAELSESKKKKLNIGRFQQQLKDEYHRRHGYDIPKEISDDNGFSCPYPENVIIRMFISNNLQLEMFQQDKEDKIAGFFYVADNRITAEDKKLLELRYKERLPYKECDEALNAAHGYTARKLPAIIRKFHLGVNRALVKNGLQTMQSYNEAMKIALDRRDHILYRSENPSERSIEMMNLSTRGKNALRRAGFITIGEVARMVRETPNWESWYRNIGKGTKNEIEQELRNLGLL